MGGEDALAQALGVSHLQLRRWLTGEETVPTDIFLLAVDLLELHDRRKEPRSAENGTPR
jgi:hypothetical protein